MNRPDFSLNPAQVHWRMVRIVNLMDDGLKYPEAMRQSADELRAHQIDGEVLPKLRKFEGVPA